MNKNEQIGENGQMRSMSPSLMSRETQRMDIKKIKV